MQLNNKIEETIQLLQNEKSTLTKRIIELEKKLEGYNDALEKNSKLKLLIEMNTYITNSLEKDEVLKRILSQTKQLLMCENSSILLVDEELNRLKFAFLSKEEEEEMLKDTNLAMGEGIAGTVWENGCPILINDVQNDPRYSNSADKKTKIKTTSLIAVPLTVNGKIIGVIEAINKIDGIFSNFDILILQYISTQSAIAIKNADLYNMAIKDGMTKLYIHKYFKNRLQEEWNRAVRNRNNLSLVIIDIDHFKGFNDTYGHLAGDMILKEIAKIILENCRSIDIACRYGGEEFTIILPETNKDEAMIFIERIRNIIENLKIQYEDYVLMLTVSGGVASIPELNPKDTNTFIEMADTALYYSKKSGRNKINFYNPTIMNKNGLS